MNEDVLMHAVVHWILAPLLIVAGALVGIGSAANRRQEFFRKQVEPILVGRCLVCHGAARKGKLDLRSKVTAMKGGEDGVVIVPGKPGDSLLYDYVSSKEMPPKKPLSAAQIAVLKRWIADGAYFPDKPLDPYSRTTDRRAGYDWWSLKPLAEVSPPEPKGIPAAWKQNPIDRFVFARLAEKKLRPSLPANPRTLIRRATYDLTGLPPSPDEVAAFLKACKAETDAPRAVSGKAYKRLIDRLLESPGYGEQWGRHWLDVVRFGESTGFERNIIIDNAWPFRDYVIRSFNEDKSFDRFIIEQLAGDVIGKGNPKVEIGTTFLVCGPYDNVGNQDPVAAAQIRANTIDEIIRATGETFLGLTVGCGRCHNHKFDPVTQGDYYSLYATFAGVRHGSRVIALPGAQKKRDATLKPLIAKRAALIRQQTKLKAAILARAKKRAAVQQSQERRRLATTIRELAEVNRRIAVVPPLPNWWVGTFRQPAGPFHIFIGGSPQRKGAAVTPASLSTLSRVAKRYRLPTGAPEGERRLALAKWIVEPSNPLTPRVLANRLWHYHFGTGIVATPSDFGFMGGRPSHPMLLDWLARQLHANRWHLKPLHRLIMLSQTYRQASVYQAAAAKIDGDSRFLWRFPPRRLSGEEIRDTVLETAGRLNLKRGGPGFRLYRYLQDNVATYVPWDHFGPETFRRAVYHQNARAARVDLMTDFDSPDCAFATPRRTATTTPLQALTLMNHSFTLEMAADLAARLKRDAGPEPAAQVRRAFELAFSRPPDKDESAAAVRLIRKYGLPAFCRALLNTNELIYVN